MTTNRNNPARIGFHVGESPANVQPVRAGIISGSENTQAAEIKPGIYYDVPDAEYRAWPYVSQSQLSLFRNDDLCEEDIRWLLEHPPEQNDGMRLGCDVEACIDGVEIARDVQCLPDHIKVRRGKAWDEWQADHPGVEWLPPSEYKATGDYLTKVHAIAEAVKFDKLAARLITGAPRQVSFVWDVTFIGMTGEEVTHRVKGRMDYLQPGIVVDLKTTAIGSPRRIGAWAWTHAWDIQAALYTDAATALLGKEHDFYFIVVRTYEPFVVTIMNGHNTTEAAGMFHQIGQRAYQVYLERLAACRRNGWEGFRFPDNPDSAVLDFQLPSYAG